MTDEMKLTHTIALLGGDLRQLAAADALRAAGYCVTLSGFDAEAGTENLPLAEALAEAEVLLLPLPTIRHDRINLPFSDERLTVSALLTWLTANRPPHLTQVFGGVIPAALTEGLRALGLRVTDLCSEERFNLLNAVPTAEGALAEAMRHLDITLYGAEAAVLGFGRIGKVLCRSLHALGAKVTAVARRERDRTEAELCGYRALSYREVPAAASRLDVIFNTVPSLVLTEPILSQLPKKCIVIDLASFPYGVDADAALRHGVCVIHALSLPGKVAPITAGRIVARCVCEKLKEAEE